MTNLSLNSTIIKPENNQEVKKAIILFHGYGGDGKDISLLGFNWKRYLKNTIIICPDANEQCPLNPLGYQWFDLSRSEEKIVLEESIKAENVANDFIESVKKKYNLKNNDICLSGFSQGCMLILNIGLTSLDVFNSIVGFSGKIINMNNLKNRIKSKPKILLIHGDQDKVVPPNNLLETKDFLMRNKIIVKTNLIKDCEHNIPTEASSIALNFILKNLS